MIASDGTLVRIRELTTVTQLADGSHVLRGLFLRNDNAPFTGTDDGVGRELRLLAHATS